MLAGLLRFSCTIGGPHACFSGRVISYSIPALPSVMSAVSHDSCLGCRWLLPGTFLRHHLDSHISCTPERVPFMSSVPSVFCEHSGKAQEKSWLRDAEIFVPQPLKIKIPSTFFLPTSIATSSTHCSAKGGYAVSSERLVTFCISVH